MVADRISIDRMRCSEEGHMEKWPRASEIPSYMYHKHEATLDLAKNPIGYSYAESLTCVHVWSRQFIFEESQYGHVTQYSQIKEILDKKSGACSSCGARSEFAEEIHAFVAILRNLVQFICNAC
jgi:hypothetical protein